MTTTPCPARGIARCTGSVGATAITEHVQADGTRVETERHVYDSATDTCSVCTWTPARVANAVLDAAARTQTDLRSALDLPEEAWQALVALAGPHTPALAPTDRHSTFQHGGYTWRPLALHYGADAPTRYVRTDTEDEPHTPIIGTYAEITKTA